MTYIATGIASGVAYSVNVDETQPATRTAEKARRSGRLGIASGSRHVINLLQDHQGETIAVTPTGPEIEVDPDDAKAILAFLYHYTTVTEVSGDAPELVPPTIPGAVY